jgi:O-antigen/teichoic acid export membrane protein
MTPVGTPGGWGAGRGIPPHLGQIGTAGGGEGEGPSFFLLKSLVRQSFLYGAFDLLGRASALILVPLYTRALGPGDYGRLEIFVVTQALLLTVATLGFQSSLTKYYVLARDDEDRTAYFRAAITAVTAWSLLLLGIGLAAAPLGGSIMGERGGAALWRIVFVSFFLDAWTTMVLALFRSQGKPVRYSAISLSKLLATLAGSVLLVGVFHLGVRGALLGTLGGSILGTLVAIGLVRSTFRPRVDRERLRALAQLGLPLAGGGLALFVMGSMDRYLLGLLADAPTLGVYALGNRVALVMGLAVNAFMLAWPPILFEIVKTPQARETLGRVITYYFAATLFVLLALTAFAREIVEVLAPAGYAGAAAVVGWLLAAQVLAGAYHLFTMGLVIRDRTRYVPLIVLVGCLVEGGVQAVLIPRWGGSGAAWGRGLGFLVISILVFRVGGRFYAVPFEWRRVAGLVILAGALVAGTRALEPLALPIREAGKALAVVLYLPGMALVGAFDADERHRLRALLRRRAAALTPKA